jgi:hypothetical protein
MLNLPSNILEPALTLLTAHYGKPSILIHDNHLSWFTPESLYLNITNHLSLPKAQWKV